MDIERRFEKLEKEFFNGWVKRHPLLASHLGLHGDADSKLPDPSVGKIQDDVKYLKRARADFAKLDPRKLSPGRAVDLKLALQQIDLKLLELEDLRLWAKVPCAPMVIGEAVFQLLSRNYMPLKKRLSCVMNRLALMPKFIRQSQELLQEPVKVYMEGEIETITRLPGFFHNLKDIARNALSPGLFNRLNDLVEDVHNALEEYTNWMIIDIFADCGNERPTDPQLYYKMLKLRGITESPTSILSRAGKEADRLKERMREVGRKIRRKTSLEDIRDLVRQQHHEHFDGAARFLREGIQKTRQFVNRAGFVPMPSEETLVVTETPSYLRHVLPLGGYFGPGFFEEKNEGFLFLTPGDCDSDRMKEHNYPSLVGRTLFEGFPGRHLQAAWQMKHPSLVRQIVSASESTAGWGHYCEERIREMGYEEALPNQFMAYNDQLWRVVQTILDIRLQSGKITVSKAVEMLIDDVGLDRVSSEAEVRRYLVTPGEPLGAWVGKDLLKGLKKDVRERMKSRYEEIHFHEAVLSSGPLPTPLLREEVMWRIDEKDEQLRQEAKERAAAERARRKTVRIEKKAKTVRKEKGKKTLRKAKAARAAAKKTVRKAKAASKKTVRKAKPAKTAAKKTVRKAKTVRAAAKKTVRKVKTARAVAKKTVRKAKPARGAAKKTVRKAKTVRAAAKKTVRKTKAAPTAKKKTVRTVKKKTLRKKK